MDWKMEFVGGKMPRQNISVSVGIPKYTYSDAPNPFDFSQKPHSTTMLYITNTGISVLC